MWSVIWGHETPALGGRLACVLLAWGSPTAPMRVVRGTRLPQAQASAHPLCLVPPPLGGALGTESWLWWRNHRPLPVLQAAEEILEGGQESRPWC